MKKLTYIFLMTLLSAIVMQFSSCSEDTDCSSTSRKMVNAVLYKYSNPTVKDSLDSLTVTAMGTDSVIINKETKVSSLELPLCWTVDSTILIFHYANTQAKDTLKIWHTNTPTFVSMECGYVMDQTISKIGYTKHRIDSIYVSYKTANTDGIQNFKLYY